MTTSLTVTSLSKESTYDHDTKLYLFHYFTFSTLPTNTGSNSYAPNARCSNLKCSFSPLSASMYPFGHAAPCTHPSYTLSRHSYRNSRARHPTSPRPLITQICVCSITPQTPRLAIPLIALLSPRTPLQQFNFVLCLPVSNLSRQKKCIVTRYREIVALFVNDSKAGG